MMKKRIKQIALLIGLICIVVALLFAGKRIYDREQRLQALKEHAITYQGITYIPNPDVTTMLVLGVDSKTPLTDNSRRPGEYGQADVIMLAAINNATGDIKVINIPRDAMVDLALYDVDGNYMEQHEGQICLQYAYGMNYKDAEYKMENIITTQIMDGLMIDHHIVIDYTVIPVVVDDMGGVKVTMSDNWQMGPVLFGAGDTIPLDGSQCYDFLLYRDTTVEGSNFTRLARQKDFLSAAVSRLKELIKENPMIIKTIYDDLDTHMNTDLSVTDITSMAGVMLEKDFDSNEDIIILEGERKMGDGLDGLPHDQLFLDNDSKMKTFINYFYIPLED